MNQAYAQQQAIRARCCHPTGHWQEFPATALEQSVIARFAAMVDRYPDRLALHMGTERFTYRALNAAANRLAHAILAQRGRGTELLALLLDQSVEAVIAMLAVWKAGKFFMALNPTDPPARLVQLLHDGNAVGIVTSSQHQGLIGRLPGIYPTLLVDELAPNLATANPPIGLQADDLACIIYTSGSTGQPKGVVYTQRNVLYRAQQFINFMHVCAEDRVALVEYYSFSGSLRDIFMTLLSGAALFLFDLKRSGVENFIQLLAQATITIWQPVTTTWRTISPRLQAAALPNLRLIAIGGETIHRQDLAAYQQGTDPACILSIGLGSSETVGSIARWWLDHQSVLPAQAVPIGYPVAGVELLLFDENGQPVPVGAIGEMAARSQHLAQGYWQQPTLTAKVFLPDPQGGTQRIYLTGDLARQSPDGQLIHMGRKDQQIKIRGHRVEIPEVEQALVALGLFKAVAVVARTGQLGDQALIAYLAPAKAKIPTATEIRALLQQTLPQPMIPARLIFLEALPLTTTGKVDLGALPAPDATRPNLAIAYHAPRTSLEVQVAAIWCAVLGLDRVGIHDNFLELGGNSLIAFQLIARVFARCQVSIPIQQLFDAPTIADMALVITQHQAAQLDDHTLQQLLREIELLAEAKHPDQQLHVEQR